MPQATIRPAYFGVVSQDMATHVSSATVERSRAQLTITSSPIYSVEQRGGCAVFRVSSFAYSRGVETSPKALGR